MSSNGVGQRECLPVLHRSNHGGAEERPAERAFDVVVRGGR
jgi:hypothetical protein